ncbi:MAG: amidohydrolase [Clostridiaceae bacterium]|nr:amidohydrolase [Clostridiaceae bacterium]
MPIPEQLFQVIRRSEGAIARLGDKIYQEPETGFKETRTARQVLDAFAALPLSRQVCAGIPGIKLTLDTGRPGPALALVGELDAVICPSHPDADPETGAVHACGHNVQIAALYGAALGLLAPGVPETLCGKIHFMAVPAEEFIELPYRKQLIGQGVLSFLGGKAELIQRGWFDDVDLCLMIHVMPAGAAKVAFQSFNGCLVKRVRFMGRAAHAGAAPQDGINALYAAHTALAAMNGIRETFPDADCVRVHPIITKGGDVLNVIPDDVRLETFVRGKTLPAIRQASFRFDRAMAGGALALGAAVEIEELPGAFPFCNDPGLVAVARQALAGLLPAEDVAEIGHTTASTDAGDLASLMPVMQPLIGCIAGGLHDASYRLIDRQLAYVTAPQLLAGTAALLLADQAHAARRIVQAYRPVFPTIDAYLEQMRAMSRTRTFPDYAGQDWPFCGGPP